MYLQPMYSHISKKLTKKSQPHLTFSGNFTHSHRLYNISSSERDSLRQDILNTVMRKTESIMQEHDTNNTYEDPTDIGNNFLFIYFAQF